VSLLNDFDTHSKLQSFIGQFTILLLSLSAFLAKALLFVEQAPLFTFYLTCLSKVNELALVNGSFVKSFQKACVVKLLYSLILKKSTNDVKTYIAGSTSIKSFNILTELKNLSI
jgi:nucleoside recognition membrane protein YjiH